MDVSIDIHTHKASYVKTGYTSKYTDGSVRSMSKHGTGFPSEYNGWRKNRGGSGGKDWGRC